MFPKASLAALTFAALAFGQNVGTYQAENHPRLPFQRCTVSGGCTTVSTGQVVLDSNWRWTHHKDGYTNCYTGNAWNTTVCPDAQTCAANCAVDGADYANTYGITTSGDALTLKFVTTNSNGKNVGSRVYLMASEDRYEAVKLLNREFTFDVDVSNLPCGLNGALYFSEMEADGGLSKFSTNKAGAKYGTGYCDSQCPKDIKWINGESNSVGWTASATDPNGGSGNFGTCCNEMDIWEANSISTAFTPHPCTVKGQYRCSGAECNTPTERYNGVCDPDGCDFNSYRLGDTGFYGPGKTVDTTKKFTVVTQFISDTVAPPAGSRRSAASTSRTAGLSRTPRSTSPASPPTTPSARSSVPHRSPSSAILTASRPRAASTEWPQVSTRTAWSLPSPSGTTTTPTCSGSTRPTPLAPPIPALLVVPAPPLVATPRTSKPTRPTLPSPTLTSSLVRSVRLTAARLVAALTQAPPSLPPRPRPRLVLRRRSMVNVAAKDGLVPPFALRARPAPSPTNGTASACKNCLS
ncbi:unnamed protein product [Cyclocybe aegerita]|uniref:Glucanase n=1 Tax=Cyclocybe aegerita TaxID=1973307 RepID=A0A8S0WHG8_CYCAE|nr:unnamed protein product [Cyclocybe aegerita]